MAIESHPRNAGDAPAPDLRSDDGVRAALTTLERVASRVARGGQEILPPDPSLLDQIDGALGRAASGARKPDDLVARPSAAPAPDWHLDGLRSALEAAPADPVAAARAGYHARWLAHLLAPDDPRYLPVVSVIIPVYNGADHVGDAVRSCLAQTYPRIEVIVVDDGSSDDLDAALASVADRILLLRQPNGGVASARNRGIRAARGELIHFLDTDDVLDPDCIERKVAALRCVPDAELCFSSYRAEGDDGYRSAVAHRVPPIGDAHCPTRDLLGTAVRRYAFHTSSVLVARWVLLETGPMDESLSRGSDTRYWFRLALRGTKVIGLRSPLDTRHFRAGSLTSYEEKHQRAWAVLFLLDLGDLLDRPSLWRYLGPLLRRMKNRTRWNLLEHLEDDQLERLRSALLSRIGRLGESRRFEDLSSRVPLRLIEAYVLSLDEVEGNPDRGAGLFRDRLVDVLRRAIPQTAEPALRDLHYWTEAVAPEDSRANRPAFLALFDWLNDTTLRGTPAVAPRELPGLSRWAPEHPWRERWWLLALLDARGGEKWACRTVRRWDPLLRPSFQLRRFLRPRTRLRAVRARVQKPTAGPSAPSHPRSNG